MTPGDLYEAFSTGNAAVGPWIAAGVGAGILLMFAYMGIRAGLRFFLRVVEGRPSDKDMIAFYDRTGKYHPDDSDWWDTNALDERDLI